MFLVSKVLVSLIYQKQKTIKMTNKTINYKGYEIEYNPSTTSHSALINLNGSLVKCIAGDIAKDGSNNRIEKAKKFIDTLK